MVNCDEIISEAEIAGYMNWRGPGAYSQGPINRIKRIVEEVARRAATAERERIINIGLQGFAGDACDFAEWLRDDDPIKGQQK